MADEGLVYKGAEGTGAAQVFKFDPYKLIADQQNKKVALAKATQDKHKDNQLAIERLMNSKIDNDNWSVAYNESLRPWIEKTQKEMYELDQKGLLTPQIAGNYAREVRAKNTISGFHNYFINVLKDELSRANIGQPTSIQNENTAKYNNIIYNPEKENGWDTYSKGVDKTAALDIYANRYLADNPQPFKKAEFTDIEDKLKQMATSFDKGKWVDAKIIAGELGFDKYNKGASVGKSAKDMFKLYLNDLYDDNAGRFKKGTDRRIGETDKKTFVDTYLELMPKDDFETVFKKPDTFSSGGVTSTKKGGLFDYDLEANQEISYKSADGKTVKTYKGTPLKSVAVRATFNTPQSITMLGQENNLVYGGIEYNQVGAVDILMKQKTKKLGEKTGLDYEWVGVLSPAEEDIKTGGVKKTSSGDTREIPLGDSYNNIKNTSLIKAAAVAAGVPYEDILQKMKVKEAQFKALNNIKQTTKTESKVDKKVEIKKETKNTAPKKVKKVWDAKQKKIVEVEG